MPNADFTNKKGKPIMKPAFFLSAVRNGSKRIIMGLVLAVALTVPRLNAAVSVDLGTAYNFAVLAATAITSIGSTVINGGNVGLDPSTLGSITGFPPGIVNAPYIIEAANGATLQAKNDLTTAYNTAAGLPVTQTLTGQDLGSRTLTPGVYFYSSSAQLTGQLTLDNQGNSDAVFVFQIGSTLTTASGSSVVTINDGPPSGSHPGISVYWQVGSSATLGTGTAFEGNILALTSITANTGASVAGRLLARNGAVTLDANRITAPPAEAQPGAAGVPDTGSTLLLLSSGLAALLAFRRRFFSPA
jgi:hypothetical protein